MRKRGTEVVGNFVDSHNQPYIVRRGWSSQISYELPQLSQQPHIRSSTPRDATQRFPDEKTGDIWYDNPQKEPIVYTLKLGRVGAGVSGIVWFSHQIHADARGNKFTSGFRLYEGAVGKKLARPFSEVAHDDFAELYPGEGVWLETDESNKPAVRLYESLGYELVANNYGRLVMTWRADGR